MQLYLPLLSMIELYGAKLWIHLWYRIWEEYPLVNSLVPNKLMETIREDLKCDLYIV